MYKLEKMTERILSEDALKHIYKCEGEGRRPTVQSIAGALQVSLDEAANLLSKMVSHNLLEIEEDQIRLTPTGREYALQVIRAHRLWERYLADETGFPEDEWHHRADRQEHLLTPDDANALAARLGHPIHDPHGDPIPTSSGDFVPHGGEPLTRLSAGETARIVHVEDEPPIVYAQLVAEGLHPGMNVQVLEASPERIRFLADGRECVLAPLLANNISVTPIAGRGAPTVSDRLSDLKPGEVGRVVSISPACRGMERRRFMDLGILPGTLIKAEMVSPSGDPTAYRIRGALIGLRKEQASLINIKRVDPSTLEPHQKREVTV